jgi:hypothetical protein
MLKTFDIEFGTTGRDLIKRRRIRISIAEYRFLKAGGVV